MARIKLYFTDKTPPELYRICFSHPLLGKEILSVRGKSQGAYDTERTFQWTAAVKALCVLILRAKALICQSTSVSALEGAVLEGGSKSQACSLDFALGKQTAWLVDVFGKDHLGRPLLRKLFSRSNPEQKRPGPVAVSLNTAAWDPAEILIYSQNREVSSPVELINMAKVISGDTAALVDEVSGPNGTHPSSDPSDNTSFHRELRNMVLREVQYGLTNTDIFNRFRLQESLKRIGQSHSFQKVAGRHKNLVDPLDAELCTSNRLGMAEDESVLKKHLCPDKSILVYLPVPGTAATALFHFLRHVKQYNLSLNLRHFHAVEMARKLICKDYSQMPDICVLGVAPAATMLAAGPLAEYHPVMILPRVSEHIVAPRGVHKHARDINHGKYIFIADDPSVPSFLFDDLQNDGYLSTSKVSKQHMEPDETFVELQDGECNKRAILFFPHFHFNALFNDCVYLQAPWNHRPNQEMVLFVHSRLMRNRTFVKYLDIALRDAWLELKTSEAWLNRIVDMMLADEDYLKVLLRSGGLQNIRLGGQIEFKV